MFIVEMVTIVTTFIVMYDIVTGKSVAFDLQISLWLWFTIIFANFAEAWLKARDGRKPILSKRTGQKPKLNDY